MRIRLILGEQIALALGLLVASDILDTVLKPSHAYELLDVIKMGFVTVLRTGLAYFLALEIKELEVEHHSKGQGMVVKKRKGSQQRAAMHQQSHSDEQEEVQYSSDPDPIQSGGSSQSDKDTQCSNGKKTNGAIGLRQRSKKTNKSS